MWIFGYGSLMWKTNFPFQLKVVGYIKGYMRRFWQASEDHRGLPGAPGRVVTIVPSPDPEDQVYGVAYEISENDVPSVIKYLDFREKDGYQQKTVIFYPSNEDLKPFQLSIYIGDTENPFYLGPAPLDLIARQIFLSEGPSGRNDDYLFQLADAMRSLAPHIDDCHLYELEKLELLKLSPNIYILVASKIVESYNIYVDKDSNTFISSFEFTLDCSLM